MIFLIPPPRGEGGRPKAGRVGAASAKSLLKRLHILVQQKGTRIDHSGGDWFNALRMLSIHPGEIGIDIRIPKSQNPEVLRLQESVANLIRSIAVRHSVLTAVGFNDELGSERNEIDDVPANRRLPPEMKTERLQFAQLHPQFDFLWGETLTKCAGIFVCQGSHHRTSSTFSYATVFPASGTKSEVAHGSARASRLLKLPPPVTSFAALTMCHPPHEGRD